MSKTTIFASGWVFILAIVIPLVICLIVAASVFDLFEGKSYDVPPPDYSTPYYSKPESDYDSDSELDKEYTIEEELSDFIGEWRRSFETKNLGYFMHFYHRGINCRNKGYQELEEYHRKLFHEFMVIDLTISGATYKKVEDGRIQLRFTLETDLDGFSDIGNVTMIMVRGENGFQIIEESWEPFNYGG